MAEAPKPSAEQHEPPEGGKKVLALSGETLCGIAIDNGFANCEKLRELPGNKDYLTRPLATGDYVHVPKKVEESDSGTTEKVHEYVRSGLPKPSIRFVHGSKDRPYKDDTTLFRVEVSNYRTDMAGLNYDKPFVDGTKPNRKFEEHADADIDTFKLEILDTRAGDGDKMVEIDALKPIHSKFGSVIGHQPFEGDRTDPTSEAGKRMLNAEASKQGSTKRFRTGYLRLVVDEWDKGTQGAQGRPDQTVLVTDGIDQAQAADSSAKTLAGDAKANKEAEAEQWRKLEILDQALIARYKLEGCPADEAASTDGKKNQKCHVVAQVPVGPILKKRVRMVLHILKEPGGAPVVDPKKAEDWSNKVLRRVYAQAGMGVKFVDPKVQTVKLPANLIMIGGPNGKSATGDKDIEIKVKIDAHAEQTVSIKTVAGDTPIKTARTLAAEIKKKLDAAGIAGVRVNATENARRRLVDGHSADVLVGNPNNQTITLTLVKDGSPGQQKAEIARVTATNNIYDFDGTYPSHVGTPDERALLKNYNTGADRIDVYLAKDFRGGIWGEAFRPKKNCDSKIRPISEITNSGMFKTEPITNPAASYTVLPHELGHVLMDMGHVSNLAGGATQPPFRPEMMIIGGHSDGGDYKEHEVPGPKRIYDSKPPMAKTKMGTGASPVTAANPATEEGSSVYWLTTKNFSVTTIW